MKKENEKQREDPSRLNKEARLQQVRKDARRPMAVNLAEAIELSEFLSRFPEGQRPTDAEVREMLRNQNAEN